MAKTNKKRFDRTSYKDAKKISENLLPDSSVREKILKFLGKIIIYANDINADNWNLNLDKHGKFIRFNVGQTYCLEILSKEILILGLRPILKTELSHKNLAVEFRGYQERKRVSSRILQDVPDCLKKVPDSVGCVVKPENIIEALPYLEIANRPFISYAISHTITSTQMKNAHSIGFIEYLSNLNSKSIPNPIYANLEEIFYSNQNTESLREVVIVADDLIEGRLRFVTSKSYDRNQTARKECIEHYQSNCIICKFDFEKKYGPIGKGYIHIHHLKPLSERKGCYQVDPEKDLRPVCPNCHAMIHKRNPPYTIEEMKDLIEKYREE